MAENGNGNGVRITNREIYDLLQEVRDIVMVDRERLEAHLQAQGHDWTREQIGDLKRLVWGIGGLFTVGGGILVAVLQRSP